MATRLIYKKNWVLSYIPNIRVNKDIAKMCHCSEAYVSRLKKEYNEFNN